MYGIKRFITSLHKSPQLVPNPSDINPVHTFYPIYLRLVFVLNLCLAELYVTFNTLIFHV